MSTAQRTLLLASLAFALGCQPPCPEGYTAELDQCVMVEEAPPHPCAELKETKVDASGDTVMVRVDMAESTCFWMDQTEVTVAAYALWLDDPSPTSWESSFCEWKSERSDPIADCTLCDAEFSPFDFDPFGANKPIRCVDFCDAEAYCRYSGKHLCYDSLANGTSAPRALWREWKIACSNGYATAFPWGDSPDPGACGRDCVDNLCGAVPVGQRNECRTDIGIDDLIGNVAEWTYACVLKSEMQPKCVIRGGSYQDDPRACDIEHVLTNDAHQPDVGFRCCADLSASERAMIDDSSSDD